MAVTLVQDKYQRIDVFETLELDAAPTAGNVLVAWTVAREVNIVNAPNGFEPHPDGFVNANSDSGQLWVREVEAGDPADLHGWQPGSDVYIAEWSGVLEYEWASSHDNETSDPIATGPDAAAGAGIVFAGVLWRTPTDTTAEAIAPTGDTVELEDEKGEGHFHPLLWAAYIEAPSAGSYSVTGDPNGALTHTWAGEIVILYEGGDLPEPPPVDPGYEPPTPGRAILEIYLHEEDAAKWDEATWDDAEWSEAGWQDVTPQGVAVHVIWGSREPELGILSQQSGASWDVITYDPDRVLDPGNPDSPWAPQLVPMVPIRVSHASSGRTIRTGLIETISYQHRRPEYRGNIRATDAIALAHMSDVPADTDLFDNLTDRVYTAIDASGIAIGGIPLAPSAIPEVPLSARIEGAASLWEHIRKAGEETLHVFYVDADGGLEVAPWGAPLDRGREITYANLEDLEARIDADGMYSVVYVANEDGTSVIERVAAPLPRYGRRAYTRSETTLDPEAWADAVLADRAWPGVAYVPGIVWCFTAADVEYFGTLEIMERVSVVFPGVVTIQGRILGMELWVSSRKDDEAQWQFLPVIAMDGSTAVGTTTLVADGSGDFLVDDTAGTDFLEVD